MRELLIYYLLFVVVVALAIAILVSRLKIKRPVRFVFFMLLLIASPVLISYLMLTYFSPLPEAAVPDLIGLTQNEAQVRVESLGLKLQVENTYEEDPDMVTFQRPEAGRMVKVGRPVMVILGRPNVLPLTPTPTLTPETPGEEKEPIW